MRGGIWKFVPLPELRLSDRLNTIVVLMRREIAQLDPNWRATPTVVLWSSVDQVELSVIKVSPLNVRQLPTSF